MDILFQNFWAFMILIMMANGLSWWVRGRHVRKQFPQRRSSYRRLVLWFVLGGSVPWLIVGAAMVFGEVTDNFSFVGPQPLGRWGLAFFASIAAISIGLCVYVFALKGAEELSEHPGLLNYSIGVQNPGVWRLIAVAIPIVNVIAFVRLWTMDTIIPTGGP